MAPLTLLVGENSTGKTSFLAILRALWEVAVNEVVPDFRREPYDLGAFSEIVYNDSSRGDQPDSFQAGFRDSNIEASGKLVSFKFTFKDVDGVTFPVSRYVVAGDAWFEFNAQPGRSGEFRLGIESRRWTVDSELIRFGSGVELLLPIDFAVGEALRRAAGQSGSSDSIREMAEQYEDLSIDQDDVERVRESERQLRFWHIGRRSFPFGRETPALYAGSPVRSKPRRTYDPLRPTTDPEGEYVPSYMSMMSRREPDKWRMLKTRLEQFGTDSGLFDEITIESFGRTDDATPFQLQVRKFGRGIKGNRRNLVDVGYGVSQALPIVTELLRPDGLPVLLLQQPEVHLHPSAQAALGSLLSSIAGSGRQLVIETHSDYIIDRVRMDVRDKKTDLKPEDVSILYFERGESDVKIHSVRLDDQGNVLDAPDSYGAFLMEETRRSIGI